MLPATHPQLPFTQAKTHINARLALATYFIPKTKSRIKITSTTILPKVHSKATLPTSNTTANGSFSNLITQTSANENTIVQAPLMFVRGGNVYPGDYLYAAGNVGYYWSSVGRSSSLAYYPSFYPGVVNPSDDFLSRNSGFFVRCVALGG